MARGNRRERVVIDDEDRKRFEVALEEVVGKMGWTLHAWVLMGNHYHLVFKTPEPNLVKGMTWFQRARLQNVSTLVTSSGGISFPVVTRRFWWRKMITSVYSCIMCI